MEPPSYAYGPPPTFYQHGFYQPMCPVYAPQPQRTIIVEPRRVVERVVPVIRRKEDWGYPPGCSDDEVEEYYSEGRFNSDGSSSDSDSEDDRKKSRKGKKAGTKSPKKPVKKKAGKKKEAKEAKSAKEKEERRKKEELDDPYFAWLRQQDGKERRGDYGPQVWYHHPPGSCSCESLRSRPQSSGNGFGRKLQQLQDRYSGNRELYERDGRETQLGRQLLSKDYSKIGDNALAMLTVAAARGMHGGADVDYRRYSYHSGHGPREGPPTHFNRGPEFDDILGHLRRAGPRSVYKFEATLAREMIKDVGRS